MAITIPTPEDQGAKSLGGVEGQAAQTPYQNLQLPDLAFDARTLGNLGGVVGDFSQELQSRYNETTLLEAQQAYSEFERDLMYNLETGVMRTEKNGALGVTDRVRSATTDFFAQYAQEKKPLTATARMALEKFGQDRQISLLDTAARHELTQNERYRAELKAAASANAVATAALAFSSDTALADQEAIIRSSTASEFAEDPNVTPETVAEVTAARVDQMYRTAISSALMVDTSAGRARAAELYARASEQGGLQLTENDPITRAVTFATEEDGRSAAADMLVAQAGGDLAKAVELAADLPAVNAEDRGKIVEDLETRMRSRERATTALQKDLEARAIGLATSGQLMTMTAAERAQLPQETYNRLLKLNAGGAAISDAPTLNLLNSLSDRQWSTVDLSSYADKLTAEDFATFSKEQADTAARLRNAEETQSVGMTTSQLVNDFADRAGLTGSDKADRRATFTLAMNDFVRVYQADNGGKPPSQDDLAAEADRLQMRAVTRQGVFMDTRTPVAEIMASPPPLVDASGQSVGPDVVRAFIREVVAIQGEAAILTPENLQALYLNYLSNL